jgi:hypothetical protein
MIFVHSSNYLNFFIFFYCQSKVNADLCFVANELQRFFEINIFVLCLISISAKTREIYLFLNEITMYIREMRHVPNIGLYTCNVYTVLWFLWGVI